MKKIKTAPLVLINMGVIAALYNLPTMALMGWSSVTYYLIAILLYFIPYTLIVSEISSSYPKESGIYLWIRDAYGPRVGFIAIYLQWFQNLIWFPTILSFITSGMSEIINPQLAHSKIYNMLTTILFYWVLTFTNIFGVRVVSIVSSIGSVLGIAVPGVLLIGGGLLLLFQGQSHLPPFEASLLAVRFDEFKNLAFLVGVVSSLSGLEISCAFGKNIHEPHKTLPRAVFISSILALVLCTLGSLAIASILPQKSIDINNGVSQAIAEVLRSYDLEFLAKVAVFCVILGGISAANIWVSGPSFGLSQAAEDGCIPLKLARVNKNGISLHSLALQGIIISLFCAAFLLLPSVGAAYWILTVISAQVYLIMYFILFLAAKKLRRTRTGYKYKIGTKYATYFLGDVGKYSCLLFIFLGFLEPAGIDSKNSSSMTRVLLQILIVAVCVLVPWFTSGYYRKKFIKRKETEEGGNPRASQLWEAKSP